MGNEKNIQLEFKYTPLDEPCGDFESEVSIDKKAKAIPMGKEHILYSKMLKSQMDEVEIQQDADLIQKAKSTVNIKKTAFGLASDYQAPRISLDVEYLGRSQNESSDELEFSLDRDYLKNINNFRIINLDTDHLQPEIPRFARLVIDYRVDFKDGDLCCYFYYGEKFFNLISKINGRVIASSYNEKYPDVYLNPEEYHFHGVVTSFHGVPPTQRPEKKI